MIFHEGFWKFALGMANKSRLEFYDAVFAFAFDGKEPETRNKEVLRCFEFVRPVIAKSRKLSASGKQGGLISQKPKGLVKQEKEEEEGKEKDTPTGVGVQKLLAPSRSLSPVSGLVSVSGVGDTPSLQETVAVATGVMGVSEEFARWWHGEMTARDWTNTDGSTIGRRNWRPVLKAWWNNRRDGEMREINEAARASKERERVYSPADWGLCRERCAKCGEHGCTAGAKVPPQFWTPPQQPEQCPRFRSI